MDIAEVHLKCIQKFKSIDKNILYFEEIKLNNIGNHKLDELFISNSKQLFIKNGSSKDINEKDRVHAPQNNKIRSLKLIVNDSNRWQYYQSINANFR